MKITNHTELRKRVSLDCSKPVLTDQSDLNSSNINTIMQNYAKTGLLPVQQDRIAQYVDNTEIPSLEEAYEQIAHAHSLFMELPAKIRKMMDNDPAQLSEFLQDPDNKEILIKHKILNKEKLDKVHFVEPSSSTAPEPKGEDKQKETSKK